MGGLKEMVTPDKKIRKIVMKMGKSDVKPYESSECVVIISNGSSELPKYIDKTNLELDTKINVIVGDNDTEFGRLFDKVLQMMNSGEMAEVSFTLQKDGVIFQLELISFKSNGFIYEWNAQYKYDLALKHKQRGVKLFLDTCYIDSSQRFSKGLKIICSIPIDVEHIPETIDGVRLHEINILKYNFYNNLASCFMKHKEYGRVIDLCDRVLTFDKNNIKGLYKMGVACIEVRDYEKASKYLSRLISLQPQNKAAVYQMKIVRGKMDEELFKYKAIVRKMFN